MRLLPPRLLPVLLTLLAMGAPVTSAQGQPLATQQATLPTSPTLSPAIVQEWHAASLEPPGRFLSVTTWSRGFAAVGRMIGPDSKMTDDEPGVWLSADGRMWTSSARLPGADGSGSALFIIDDGAGLLVAGVVRRRHLAVWRSRDGSTWRRVADQDAFHPRGIPPDYFPWLESVVRAGGTVLITGAYLRLGDSEPYPRVWSSTDGRTWRQDRPSGEGHWGIEQPTAAGGRFAAVTRATPGESAGCDAPWVVITSAQGRRWRRAGAPFCLQPHGLAWSPAEDGWFVLGNDGFGGPASIVRDIGGGGWEVVHGMAIDAAGGGTSPGSWAEWQAADLVAAGGAVVAVGQVRLSAEDGRGTSTMWSLTSHDGLAWELSMGWPVMVGQAPVDYPTVAATADGDVVVVALDRGGVVWLVLEP